LIFCVFFNVAYKQQKSKKSVKIELLACSFDPTTLNFMHYCVYFTDFFVKLNQKNRTDIVKCLNKLSKIGDKTASGETRYA